MPDDSRDDRDERMQERMRRVFAVGSERFLADLGDNIRAEVERHGDAGSSHWVGMAQGAVGALVAVGEVSYDRQHEVVRQLVSPLVESGSITPVTAFATSQGTLSTSRGEPNVAPQQRDPLDLRHVIPISQVIRLPDGRSAVVTCVELWADEVILRWREQSAPGGAGNEPFVHHWELTDDVGADYRRTGGGAHGGDDALDCSVHFGNAPTSTASALRFVLGDESISVSLTVR